jgi:hypothetical protein
MPKIVTPQQIKVYWELRGAGHSMAKSCQFAKFSLSKAQELEKGKKRDQTVTALQSAAEENLPGPKRYDELCDEAKRAHDDFGYFQRRYFGRIPVPWQTEAAERVVKLLATPEEEYVVTNAPPGSGKTLLFTHDIPAWLTVRNRSLTGQMGSVTGPLAERYTNRLRRTLERTLPIKASTDALQRGTALDAEACLAADFGRFKPMERELWTASAFVVEQYADLGAITEKEPTWSAYGIDQGFIGGRYMFIVWDDLVDPRKQRSLEAKEALKSDWDDLAETRLEPGGLLILQGQRIDADDLYRYNLDKVVPTMEDPETGEILESVKKYHHIKFQAHYEDRCKPPGTHRRDAKPYPEGCLLSPSRINWRKITQLRHTGKNRFEVLYQQEDVDPETVLVNRNWIYGDDDHIGCLDFERDRLELPKDIKPPLMSYMTVDPSPTKYWGIQWWIYQPATEQRFLMDLEKKQLDAPDFLDYDATTQKYSGLLEEWVQTANDKGWPIRYLIVEINAAQRFLLQYDFVQKWQMLRGVNIIPHSTQRNKSDPEFGVQMLGPLYERGGVRLPWKPDSLGRFASMKLMEEVTTYPHGRTTDQVMSQWFGEFQLPRLYRPPKPAPRQKRPTWLAGKPY